MPYRKTAAVLIGVLGVMLLIGVIAASTASNTVPGTQLGQRSLSIDANALKPAQCAALNLTTVITGSGTFSGTSGNDLILGRANTDKINGGSGNDCILGGAGNDTLTGGSGTDVCIGGPGTNHFNSCESTY